MSKNRPRNPHPLPASYGVAPDLSESERWEYRLDYPGLADGSDEALQRAMNDAGLDGWEIVTYSFKARQVLMKRKIV